MSFSSDFLSRPSIESGLRGKATADTNIAGPQTLEMFVPADDVAEPELTILVPALNEATTTSRFLLGSVRSVPDRRGVSDVHLPANGARPRSCTAESSSDAGCSGWC